MVAKEYDGDTVTLVFDMGGDVYRLSSRVRSVDCPEMRGRSDREKEVACLVRDTVKHFGLNYVCNNQTHGLENYGRPIANIELFDGNGLARPNAGKRRRPFENDKLDVIMQQRKVCPPDDETL